MSLGTPGKDKEVYRLDKWLWAVRLYKSRSMAAEAIKGGKVKCNGETVKPGKQVKLGDVFVLQHQHITKTIKAIGLPVSRIGAPLVPEYLEDLTPPEQKDAIERLRERPFFFRPRGIGRPTKRDRRKMDELNEPDR